MWSERIIWHTQYSLYRAMSPTSNKKNFVEQQIILIDSLILCSSPKGNTEYY